MNKEEMTEKYGEEFIANVIRIIDKRTILVNAGKGVLKVGQKVEVYEPGQEIKDLDGKVLSKYTFVKDELEVIRVEFSYSVCQKQTSVTKQTNLFALSPLLSTTTTEYLPLNIDSTDIEELKPSDPLVRVGDPVRIA